ncbi:MAG TPA: hypothetical protein VNI54_09570 [Thermoanaerobaculia bacterium]|nr:hypothetical protein [Thermoanaerobaculia bacterium]
MRRIEMRLLDACELLEKRVFRRYGKGDAEKSERSIFSRASTREVSVRK